MARQRQVREFAAGLVELETAGFRSQDVHAYLLETPIDPLSLRPYSCFSLTHYMRNLIHRTDRFELIAICWEVGQVSPVHDHENERCWARVEVGSLHFTNHRIVSEEPLHLEQSEPVVVGVQNYVDALPGIHRVANPASLGQRALSLHLYSRPFHACTVYDLDKGLKGRRQLRYDSVPA